jgi:cobalt/nickel transport protein
MNLTKKLWIMIGILLLLSPLGIIIPAWFEAGGAWGEWGSDEIAQMVGFVPEGMKRLGEAWKAPLPDYAIPGQGGGLASKSAGYVFSAVIGIALAAAIMFLIAKVLVRRKDDK